MEISKMILGQCREKKNITLLILYCIFLMFIITALVRRLNFDECLALHAGWLTVEGIDATPYFHMPFTVILGWIAHWIEDPGALFAVIRLFISISLISLFVFSAKALKLPFSVSACACFLLFSNGTFLTHALEFRYDWAIIVGWIIGFVTLYRLPPKAPIILGICIAWLCTHHLKGAYFGGWLYIFVICEFLTLPGRRKNNILQFNAALVLTLGAWLILTYISGQTHELVNFYKEYLSLSVGADKVWPWDSLSERFYKDGSWWLIALFSLVAMLRLRNSRLIKWATLFLLVPFSFLFTHPHAWAYMLVPLLPFVSLLAAIGIIEILTHPLVSQNKFKFSIYLAIFLIVIPSYIDNLARSLTATRSNQVETLRALKSMHKPSDTIIDPTGMAYFMRPAVPDWYLDTLFCQKKGYADWVKQPSDYITSDTWLLNTYRISSCRDYSEKFFKENFRSVGGGLSLYKESLIHAQVGLGFNIHHQQLRSFW